MANDYEPDPRPKPLQWPASLDLGGGSGIGQVYVDRYPANPDDTSQAALSYSSSDGSMQQWIPASQTWQ